MQDRLSTHVLDTARGCPAAGVAIELWRLEPTAQRIGGGVTDADGRLPGLLPEGPFVPGRYELRFHTGAYFATAGLGEQPPFHDVIAVRVQLDATVAHYHVPLLVCPYGYTTYRGS